MRTQNSQTNKQQRAAAILIIIISSFLSISHALRHFLTQQHLQTRMLFNMIFRLFLNIGHKHLVCVFLARLGESAITAINSVPVASRGNRDLWETTPQGARGRRGSKACMWLALLARSPRLQWVLLLQNGRLCAGTFVLFRGICSLSGDFCASVH